MTSNPFKAAADVVQKFENMEPITRRPQWQRAERLFAEMRRDLGRYPDDDFVDEPNSRPGL